MTNELQQVPLHQFDAVPSNIMTKQDQAATASFGSYQRK